MIMELPRKFRDPLILRFHYQFSMEEIAEILNISVERSNQESTALNRKQRIS